MVHTLVAVYDDSIRAQGAYNDLLASGLDHAHVQLAPAGDSSEARQAALQAAPAENTRDAGHQSFASGIRHFFHDLFTGNDEYLEHAHMYAEAVRRGHYVLTVNADNDEQSEQAAHIMNRFAPLDIEERATQWKSRGWSGYDQHAPMMSDEEIGVERQFYTSEGRAMPTTQADRVISSDSLTGRSSVRKYPRSHSAALDSSVRMPEDPESLERHSQTEPAPGSSGRAAGAGSDDDEYRQHFAETYGVEAGKYEDYAQAYRHGSTAASDERYRGYRWDEAEQHVRKDWESRHGTATPWEKARAAVRHGWEKLTR